MHSRIVGCEIRHSYYEPRAPIFEGMKTFHLLPVAAITCLLTAACGPSLATMHEGAVGGRVQKDAPLHARQSVIIAAPRERVYALVTDVAATTDGFLLSWFYGQKDLEAEIRRILSDSKRRTA